MKLPEPLIQALDYIKTVGLANYSMEGLQSYIKAPDVVINYKDPIDVVKALLDVCDVGVHEACQGFSMENPHDNLVEILIMRLEELAAYKFLFMQLKPFLIENPLQGIPLFLHQKEKLNLYLQWAGYRLEPCSATIKKVFLHTQLLKLWWEWCYEKEPLSENALARIDKIATQFEEFPNNIIQIIQDNLFFNQNI